MSEGGAQTLWSLVDRHAAVAPARPALQDDAGVVTYGALRDRALDAARRFHGLGIGPGDIVAAQLPNSVEFVVTLLAALRCGAALQTMHMPYREADMGPLLAHSRAKLFVGLAEGKDFSPAGFVAGLPSGPSVLAIGGKAPDRAHAWPGPAPDADAILPTEPTASDRFLLLYTSGTTAAPKGAPVRFENFLPNAAASAAALGLDERARLMSVAPFTHLYGLFTLNMAFATGATMALFPAFAPDALIAALKRHRPTALFVAPAHMAACRSQGLLTSDAMTGLRFVMISGAYCPPELASAVDDALPDGEALQLWGMSELQAGSFTRPGDPPGVRHGTAGRASPGTRLRLVRDGAPVGTEEEGELEVKGPSVFAGYLDNPAANASAFTEDGWFRTGDLAVMDADGNLRLTGRTKEIINRGGVKYNPAEIEALLLRHPAVAACAIVPMADAVLGERACVFVTPAPGHAPTLEDLCVYLSALSVAKLKWPERLEVIDEMPMTPTRKIMKGVLQKRLGATSRL